MESVSGYQFSKVSVPGLHPTGGKELPQQTCCPEDGRVKPIKILEMQESSENRFDILFPLYLAAAGSVEPAELLRLGWVVVAGVLLDVLKLKELDVCVQKYVAKGVGPNNLRRHYCNYSSRDILYREGLH